MGTKRFENSEWSWNAKSNVEHRGSVTATLEDVQEAAALAGLGVLL